MDNRPPRGAIVVVVIGLVATVAAAALATTKPLGSTELDWVAKTPLPDSAPAAIPGGGDMRIGESGIRTTDYNAGGYRVYRVASVLTIDAGAAVGQGRVRCTTSVPRPRTLVAHTPNSRAAFPRSSSGKDLRKQGDVPELIEIEFSSHGGDFALVKLGDAFARYTTVPGVVASWAPYEVGVQGWQWGLPAGRPEEPLELGFASFWRTTGTPGAKVSCTVETSAGSATVRTAGSLQA